MKIVVLDGFTMNPGDIAWQPLLDLGECELFERTEPEQVLERAAGADILLTNKVILTAAHFAALPQLRYVGIMATGTNVVDLPAAKQHGVVVTNVPAYSTMSVAQMVFALLLELTQQVGYHNRRVVEDNAWCTSADFSFRERPLVELAGLRLGLVGYGRIGQAVAKIAASFAMQVVVATRRPLTAAPEVEQLALEQLFASCDVISLNCPLTADTTNIINARSLALMKPSAVLINTARGGLIDEVALAQALRSGALAGAGLDVLSSEPPAADNPLLHAPNCVISPHLGWATLAARQRLFTQLVENIKAYMADTPLNIVNGG
ncbi:MAG: D-2-hydroxyacid dehydrogenase [Desulfuromonas sp.]|nr:D-2-hydroxyacid dehydrogenase [Desulfuromonas sp.]